MQAPTCPMLGLSSGKAKLASEKASYIVGFMSKKRDCVHKCGFPNEAKSITRKLRLECHCFQPSAVSSTWASWRVDSLGAWSSALAHEDPWPGMWLAECIEGSPGSTFTQNSRFSSLSYPTQTFYYHVMKLKFIVSSYNSVVIKTCWAMYFSR